MIVTLVTDPILKWKETSLLIPTKTLIGCGKLVNQKTVEVLQKKIALIPMFDNIGIGILERLLQVSQIVTFNENEIVVLPDKKVENIFIILSGRCEMEYLCKQNGVLRREMSARDVFGFKALYVPTLHTNKVKAITELVCIKVSIANIKADQEILNALTPNFTKYLIENYLSTQDELGRLLERYVKPELPKEDIEPQIIKDRNSKITQIKLTTGQTVVLSTVDERRLRRQQVTVEELNREYLSKLMPEIEMIAKEA